MRKTILILALTIFGLSSALTQEKIKWYTIQEAVQLARQEPRVLVIDVYTDWCGWCKRMDATTFADPSIVAIMNEQFYPVKLNAEGKEDIVLGDRTYKFVPSGQRGYHEVAAIVTKGRLSYPTLSYVDGQGRVLEAAPGYKQPGELKIYLAYYASEAYKTESFEDFSKTYQAEL